MSTIAITPGLKNNFGTLCKNHYERIAEIANKTLLHVFIDIGRLYNEACKVDDFAAADNPALTDLAKTLHEKYGPYFQKENIVRMAKFQGNLLAYPNLVQIAYFVTWEHIVLLLPFDDFATWLFYIRLCVENDWSVDDLQKAINSNAFENDELFLGKRSLKRAFQKSLTHTSIDENFQPLWLIKMQKRVWKPGVNLFKEPLLSPFKALFDLENYKAQTNAVNTDTTSSNPLNEICARINWAIPHLNQTLNQDFNMFMRETGRSLSAEYNTFPPENNSNTIVERHIFIPLISAKAAQGQTHDFKTVFTRQELLESEKLITAATEQLFETLFTVEQLQNMLVFSQKTTDIRTLFRIAHLVTWDYLTELIKLPTQETIQQYALKCADENLTKTQLKQAIDQELISETKPQSTKSKNQPKSTVTDNEVFNKKVAVNIFHNNFFMQFVSAFSINQIPIH